MTEPSGAVEAVELLPCPFCGSDETSHGFVNAGMIMGNCECHACNACIWAETEAEAIAAWNTRATPSDQEKRISELEREIIRLHGKLHPAGSAVDLHTMSILERPERSPK